MASTISTNEVVRIAQLARLHLTENELKSFGKDLSEILDYMNQIKKGDDERYIFHFSAEK